MAEARGVSPKKILDRIMVARAYTSDHQMLLVDKVDELINREGKNIKLVIVDSLMSLFRSEYAGRGTLAVRQQKLNRHLHALQRLADKHNLAVYENLVIRLLQLVDTFSDTHHNSDFI
jgi:DNA repair protein RadA